MDLREHEVVRLGSMTETLSIIPYLVGFHPHSSMVVVCLHGDRRRSGLVMRSDLPDALAAGAWAAEVAARAEHQRADGVLMVCYSDEPNRESELAQQALADVLLAAFSARGVDVIDAALVRHNRWWSYLCCQPECCPASGTPLPDVLGGGAARIGAAAALHGRSPLTSRAELEATVAGPTGAALEAAREAFERAYVHDRARRRRDGRVGLTRQTVCAVEEALTAYTTGDGRMEDEMVATICVGLEEKPARDQVASLDVHEPAVWLALLTHLAQRTPDEASAPICTTLAWAAYGSGDGALANVALDRALNHRPDYDMALLLRAASDRQVPPTVVQQVAQDVRSTYVFERAADAEDGIHD